MSNHQNVWMNVVLNFTHTRYYDYVFLSTTISSHCCKRQIFTKIFSRKLNQNHLASHLYCQAALDIPLTKNNQTRTAPCFTPKDYLIFNHWPACGYLSSLVILPHFLFQNHPFFWSLFLRSIQRLPIHRGGTCTRCKSFVNLLVAAVRHDSARMPLTIVWLERTLTGENFGLVIFR